MQPISVVQRIINQLKTNNKGANVDLLINKLTPIDRAAIIFNLGFMLKFGLIHYDKNNNIVRLAEPLQAFFGIRSQK